VWTLRRFRDNILAETWYGRAFIKIYYAISPTIVKWFGHAKWFNHMWRGALDRMVDKLQSNGVESTPYEDENSKI
jgi:cold-shock DNA-binding domain protein